MRLATTRPLLRVATTRPLLRLATRPLLRRCSTSTVEANTVKSLFLQGAGRRRNGIGQTRVCAVVTGGGGRLFSHLLGEPGATSFLLEGTIPYDKHAFLGYLSAQNRELPAGFCSAASAVALARAARDRAIALTKRIERWPDCAGVGATATIISHYPRRGGYRAHAAAADAFDTAHSYEHVMVKGARERQGEDAAVARLALRACAELAGVPEEVATTLRTHGIVLEPVESTNAVGEVANGVETVPVQVAVAPEAATARVWVPGVERPIVAPASLPEDALIVPWEPQETTPPTLAADALRALGREGEEGDGPWIDPPAPVLFDAGPPDLDAAAATAAVPAMVGEGGAEKKMRSVSNWGVLELLEPVEVDAAAHRLALLVNRYPRATFALSSDAAFALTSNRDLVISMAAGGARFVVQEGAVEAAKRAWELPAPVLSAFTWIGAEGNDVRNVQSVGGEAAATEHEYEGRVSELTDGSPSTEIGTGRYAGGWSDGRPHGTGTMEWDNGITFKGEWLSGQFHGWGSKLYSRGGGYEGEWKHGKRHGRGTIFYKYGKWEGSFVDDKPDGSGTMFYEGEPAKPFRFESGKPLDGEEPKHRG